MIKDLQQYIKKVYMNTYGIGIQTQKKEHVWSLILRGVVLFLV